MTQQPYYPPQYPQYPQPAQQQGYAPQQQYQPPAPQNPYPYQGQPGQGSYGPPGPPQPPAQPLAQGTLDDYFNQPSMAGGPSISWSGPQGAKPIGTRYTGIVARPVTKADIQQQTDPQTRQPKFFRDGRPMFVMTVPLRVQPSQEFPQGEATWFVRGQARDELVRAMAEAGAPAGPPEHGAGVVVTLVQRRPSRMGNPANIVQVQYTRPQGAARASAYQANPDAASPASEPAAQPAATPAASQPPPPAAYTQPPPPPQQQPQQYPAPQPPPQPYAQPPQQPQPPSDMSPEQQALLARLTGGQPQAAAS